MQSWHGTPRLGHSSDVSVLFKDDADGTSDYVLGLLFLLFLESWQASCMCDNRSDFAAAAVLHLHSTETCVINSD